MKDEAPRRGRPVLEKNEVTSDLLTTGEATMAQIAQLFRTDAKTLPRRLRGMKPTGLRKGVRVFDIRDAAARVVKPGYSIEQYIRNMHPNDLPNGLHKEFWAALKSRLEYEIKNGDLWPTAQVIEAFAEAFKTAKMELLLVPDALERETELSALQRKIVERYMDAAIESLRDALVTRFTDYEPSTGQQGLFAEPDSGLEPTEDGDGVFDSEEDEEDDL